MSEDYSQQVLQAVEALRSDHQTLRTEQRSDMQEVRSSFKKMADSISELSRIMAISEERHSRHESAMHRIGGQLDDHEARIRHTEKMAPAPEKCAAHNQRMAQIEEDAEILKESVREHIAGSRATWRTLTIVGAVSATIASLIVGAVKLWTGQ